MKLCMIIVTVMCVWAATAQAGDTTMRYGAWVSGGIDLHDAGFSKFTDVGFCCPSDFGAQKGLSFRLGGMFSVAPLPSVSKRLLLDARVGVGYSSATFSTTEQTLFNDPEGGANDAVEATFDYIIQPSWMSATVDVMPSYRITSGLTAHLGVRGAILFSDQYEQTEKISDTYADQGFIFTDTQSPERNLASGSIPGLTSIAWSIVGGVSWEFPLNAEGTFFLAPELFATIPLNDLSSAVTHADGSPGTWSMASVSAGVSLRFASVPTITPDPCDTIIDGVMQNKQCPDGQVLAFDPETNQCNCRDTTKVDSVIVRIDPVSAGRNDVVIETFKVRHWIPTLPFIYFDRGVSTLDLSDVYRDVSPQRRMTFDVEPSFQRDIHGHVLNIIGKRMFEHPEATLQIIGGHARNDGEADAVARDRAFAVRDYLYQRWGIDFDRMTVTSGGAARTVELRASTPDILAPVEMPSTSIIIRPSFVDINATIQAGASRSVASITYSLKVGGGTGRRPKPLTKTFNAGEAGFDEAMHGWKADISAPDGRIFDAVKGQLDATDLVLMPSLEVTFTTGQKMAAEQDVRATTMPMSVLTPEVKAQRGLADTVELLIDVLFPYPDADTLEAASTALLTSLTSTIPTSVTAVLHVPAAITSSQAGTLQTWLSTRGYRVERSATASTPIAAPRDEMTEAYARSVRIVFRIPRGG